VRAVARTWPLRGLTATREGRLAVIIVVAGVLVVGLRLADVVAAHKADDMSDDIRRSLRTQLSPLTDDEIATFGAGSSEPGSSEPGSSEGGGTGAVEAAAQRALRHHTARLLAIGASDDAAPPLVLVVETGWGWQARCIRAELRGHGTVLTTVRRSHC
jgi:hypothetical protein